MMMMSRDMCCDLSFENRIAVLPCLQRVERLMAPLLRVNKEAGMMRYIDT